MTISAAAALLDILDREGVRFVFGVPGGPLLPLMDLIARHPRIRFVLNRHEQGAAYAAYAYALASGQLGVCAATLGPGATNLLAGLPVARVESVPLLAITGQVQTAAFAHGAHQESTGWFGTPDQSAMFRATCKQSVTIMEVERLPEMTRHLIRIACAGRPGPVHMALPANILMQPVDHRPLPPSAYRITEDRSCDQLAAARVAAALARARRPALLLGGRARQSGAGRAAETLAARCGAALAVDLACKTVVDERHPNYLGCIGVLGHKAAELFLKSEADLVVAIGQTFNEVSTLSWDPALATGKALIQLDCDADEIGKVFPVSDASVGNLAAMLEAITQALPLAPEVDERLAYLARFRQRHPLVDAPEMRHTGSPPKPPRVIADLAAALPENALILSDSSKWARWLGRYVLLPREAMLSAHDYEPMGWAVAGAVGAKLAFPDRPVIAMSGDGAFMMSAMELSAAADLGLDIVWLVMNDSRLGIIYDLQKGLFRGNTIATSFTSPDLLSFAKAVGAHGRLVERPGELGDAVRVAISAGGLHLIDVRFDPDDIPPVRPRSLHITKGMGLPAPTPGPETTRALLKLLKER